MGNTIGGRKKAKVMKIDGETFKIKTPVRAFDVVKDYPGHVLLESELVKRFGIRAKPLEPQQELKPKKIYFLVELPKPPEGRITRRARSEVHMSAKDRLECLMLSRRSVSDLSVMRPIGCDPDGSGPSSAQSGPVRVKLRLPKAQLEKMVEESRDDAEVAEKVMDFYVKKAGEEVRRVGLDEDDQGLLLHQQGQWKPGLGRIGESLQGS